MKILITGGLGFIGAHLAYELKNHEITILDRFGKIDFLINNAGIGNFAQLKDLLHKYN